MCGCLRWTTEDPASLAYSSKKKWRRNVGLLLTSWLTPNTCQHAWQGVVTPCCSQTAHQSSDSSEFGYFSVFWDYLTPWLLRWSFWQASMQGLFVLPHRALHKVCRVRSLALPAMPTGTGIMVHVSSCLVPCRFGRDSASQLRNVCCCVSVFHQGIWV